MADSTEIIVTLTFIAGVLILAFLAGFAQCNAKAVALGYRADYKPFQGCVLIKKNGQKVLLEQLREFTTPEI